MGLAAIQPSPSTAAAVSSPPKPEQTHDSELQQQFYINKPEPVSNSIEPVPPPPAPPAQILAKSERKLVFDSSDSRRPLDDWELEDYVLVATVEGDLYALDRFSGATKWVLDGNGPAVRSVASKFEVNTTTKEILVSGADQQQPRWMVQPIEGGQLFLYESEFGVVVIHPSRMTLLTRDL